MSGDGAPDGGEGPVELEVPAQVEYVRLVRMVVATLAASRRDLDDDRLDDLRLAVSEACTLALDGLGDDGRLTVVCREEPDAFIVDVEERGRRRAAGSAPAAGESGDEDDGLALALISALVDEVSDVGSDGAAVLRLRISCAPAVAAS